MSYATHEATISEISRLVQETAVEVAWRQWAALGAGTLTSPDSRARSIIDPEALLLLSLVVQASERRLADFVAWWAQVGSTLVSVQRTKTMLTRFPATASTELKAFARLAADAGDKRWKRHAADGEPPWGERRLKGADEPRLRAASTLMVRLRAGFGVNAKADALSFLLGREGGAATVQEIARAVGYSTVAVRNALKDMVLARLVHEAPGHPARYFVHVEPWGMLLDLVPADTVPSWTYWYPLHAFLANSYVLFKRESLEERSPYLLSSSARDLVDQFTVAFANNRIPLPNAMTYSGAEYLDGCLQIMNALKTWIEEHG